MKKLALPVPSGPRVLILLVALFALALPAAAAAAEPLAVTPNPASAPKTTVGMSSGVVQVELRNDDPEAAKIESIGLGGEDAGQFGIQGSNCGTLEQGQSCQVWFWFAPNSVGTKQAELSVAVHERGTQSVPLSAVAVPVQMSWNPGSHDFGLQWVNRGDESYFELENSGEAPVYMGNIGIGGADTGNFWTSESNCWSLPGNLIEPGQTCGVRVYFQPHDTRAYEAELVATVGGVDFSAALSGAGGRAELVPSSNPFDFGSAAVGGVGELRTIVLSNEGSLPGSFFIAVIAGGDSGSFELLEEDCSGFEPVGPGETCSAKVRFKPQGPGAKSARLAMFGEDDGGTMIMLQGEGVASQVGLSAAGLGFGSQQAGSRGVAQTLLVENGGPTAATVDRVALAGVDPDQFVLAGDECTELTLAPGASCALRVRFAPDSAGPKAATLKVVGGFGTLNATLSGAGTPAAAPTASIVPPVAPGYQPPPASQPRTKRFARNATIHAPKGAKARRSSLKKPKSAKLAQGRGGARR